MAARFPVAPSCEAAVRAPSGWGARARDAAEAAHGREVRFVTEVFGPVFATRGAAAAAHEALLASEWCALRPVVDAAAPPPLARPVNRDGVRWPSPDAAAPPTLWRLSVSYWRIQGEEIERALPVARRARRERGTAGVLDGAALGRLTDQPLRPFRPQQPLDVGLFEARLPEAPDVIVADD